MLCFSHKLEKTSSVFPLSAIFLFFFFCALVCCVKVCVTNPFIFELLLEFLAHPFSLSSHFSHEKNQPRNLHFLFLLSPFSVSLLLSTFFLIFYHHFFFHHFFFLSICSSLFAFLIFFSSLLSPLFLYFSISLFLFLFFLYLMFTYLFFSIASFFFCLSLLILISLFSCFFSRFSRLSFFQKNQNFLWSIF